MKYYLIAGERSGDLHGGNLAKALYQIDPQAEMQGFGGDHMRSAGVKITLHYEKMAFMGFLEVVRNIRAISKNMALCKKDLLAYQPDALILIDYAGFNMRMAKFAKKHGLKVFYYISPKVWAWNQKRALKIKANVDRMFAIMPFEVGFYQKFGWKVDYVGNPVVDAVAAHKADPSFLNAMGITDTKKKVVALLPGSRKQELNYILPIMTGVAKACTDFHFVVAAVNNLDGQLYDEIRSLPNVSLCYDQSYDLLSYAHTAIVASGTATLETALFGVPQTVVYKTSGVTYQIAKRLIRVPYISLVNLIVDRAIVKELIQGDATVSNTTAALHELTDGSERAKVLEGYEALHQVIGGPGVSQRTAKLMFDNL